MRPYLGSMLLCIGFVAVLNCNAEDSEPKLADGVQRVADEVFLHDVTWLNNWRADFLPILSKLEGKTALMIVALRNQKSETISVVERRGERVVGSPGAAPLLGYTLIHAVKSQGQLTSRQKDIEPKKIEKTIGIAWNLVREAGIDTQEINFATDDNDTWYLFSCEINSVGTIVSSLQVAQGLNPPKGGVLQKLRSSLLQLFEQ